MRPEGDDIFDALFKGGGLPEGQSGDRSGPERPDAAGQPAGDASDGGAIPDALVDRFFDNELDESARRAFLRSIPADLDRCEEVARTRRMLDMFKASVVQGPDLTGKIIATVDRQRGFASRHVRRVARVARLAIAAGVVLVVGAVAAVERVAPDATRLAPAPAPLTSALRESQAELASTLGSLTTTVDTIQQRVAQGLHGEHAGAHALVHAHGDLAGQRHHDASVDHVMVVGRVERSGAARGVAVSFSLSSKAGAGSMVWTADMAPRGSGQTSWVGLVDAEGRCAAFNTPMGICRQGDAPGPYVLPGREVETVRFRAGALSPLGGSMKP